MGILSMLQWMSDFKCVGHSPDTPYAHNLKMGSMAEVESDVDEDMAESPRESELNSR